ncbi:MAG: hypothetical protein KF678_08675 [Phycisphaeraceae bacterium]|nr:hypothetical protein [Phycisphaeraceae bacterium]
MNRRRVPSPALGNALLAAMLVAVQFLLPAVHAQHLASHSKATPPATTCCHHHDHPDQPESPDDESCTLCIELAIVRHGSLTPDGHLVLSFCTHATDIVRHVPSGSPSTPDLSTGPPRGPPTA